MAKDIVEHFLGRGFPGKAIVVSIDKVTVVRTYDKVQRYWAERLEADERELQSGTLPRRRGLTCWSVRSPSCVATDMAVVISQSQNEIAEMAERGLDIRPHRKRIVEENLEEKFKNPQDPFRPCLRLLDVDHRIRRAVAIHRVSGQAAPEPHADADDHPSQPGLSRRRTTA